MKVPGESRGLFLFQKFIFVHVIKKDGGNRSNEVLATCNNVVPHPTQKRRDNLTTASFDNELL